MTKTGNPYEKKYEKSKFIKSFEKFYSTKGAQFAVRHVFVLLSFLIPFVLMLIVFKNAGMYPWGDQQIATIDGWHQYFPFTMQMQDKLETGGSLLYSLQSGWGTNFLGTMSYYTASPLNFLTGLLPSDWLRPMLCIFVCIKIGLAGAFMSMFLKHTFRRNDFSILLFSIPYAMCAYLMGYYWCIMWVDTVALLPLVALGAVKLIREGKFLLYSISLAAAFFANFYIGFFVCIFMVLLFIMAVISLKLNIKTILKRLWQMALFSALGLALTAVLTVPAYFALSHTYTTGNTEWPAQMNFINNFIDVLGNLLAYQTPTHLDGLPNLYCSFLAVILLGVYALAKKIPVREKIAAAVLLTFLIISCNNNVLDFIWHGFHYTNQIPFRFSFIFSFVLIVVAYRAFVSLDKVKWYHIVSAAAVMIAFIAIGYNSSEVTDKEIEKNIALGIAYIGLMAVLLIKSSFINTKVIAVIMIFPMCIEMYAAAKEGVKACGSSSYETYLASNDDVQTLLSQSNPADDDFYRTEMSNWYTVNDPSLYGYYGVSTFSSMADSRVSEYMENLGLIANPGENKYYYTTTTPFANALLNLKYIIAKDGYNADTHLKETGSSGIAKLYENESYLPFGFMSDSALLDFNLSNPNNPFYYQNALFRAMTGINEDLYSYVPMTSSEGESAHLLNGDNATGFYQFAPGDDSTTVLFSGEHALNWSDEKIDGVSAGTFYHLEPGELAEAGDLENKIINVTFKYQDNAELWEEDSGMFFYAPSDPDQQSEIVDFEFEPGEAIIFPVEINDAIIESGLAIEGHGIVITEITVTDEDSGASEANDQPATLKMNYTAMSDAMLYCYFDCPGSEIKNLNAQIGQDSASKSYLCEYNLQYVFPIGYAKEGQTAILSGTTEEPVTASSSFTMFVYQLNEDVWQKGLEKLKSNGTYDITERSDTYFKGSIDVSQRGVMYTAVPAEGWTAYVDGEKAETAELCGAVLGIELDEGSHIVEFKYSPPGFKAGILISLAGAAGLVLACIISSKVRKRRALTGASEDIPDGDDLQCETEDDESIAQDDDESAGASDDQ